jgi:hypothetical protein
MKLTDARVKGTFEWERRGRLYKCMAVCAFDFRTDKLSSDACYRIIFRHGALTDGISTPRRFRRILPSWKPKNPLYCMVGAAHDALYATKGFGGIFSREDSDHILRGGLTCSHEDVFISGAADLAVAVFASHHWGRDENDLKSFVELELAPW